MKIDKEELLQAMEEALNQEVEELLQSTADDETIEREAEAAMGRMDWKRIYRETNKQTKQYFFGWSKVAMIFLLVLIAGSVSVYAASKIFRTGIQWIVKQGEGEDDFLFEVENPVATVVPTGRIETEESDPKTENAPKDIERRYKPVYIANGYTEVGEKRKEGLYRVTYKNKQKTLFFYQRTKTAEMVAEPILSEKESIMVGGYHGVIGYRAKKKLLQYANEQYVFQLVTEEAVAQEEMIRMAESVTKMAPDVLEVYYEPAYLPDGYELCKEESIMDDNILHDMLYVKKAQGDIVGSVSYSQNILDAAISIDNINMTREIVDINGWKGQLNYEKDKKSLIWATNEYSFMVHGTGEISKEEVLKIARSMAPVK